MLSTGSSGNRNMLCYLLGFFLSYFRNIFKRFDLYQEKHLWCKQWCVRCLSHSLSHLTSCVLLLVSLSTLMSRSFTSLILAQGGPPTPKLNEHSLSHCNFFFFYSPPSRSNQWGCDTQKSRFTVLVFSLESKISKMKTERSKCYLV